MISEQDFVRIKDALSTTDVVELSEKLPDVGYNAVYSQMSQNHQNHLRKTSHLHRAEAAFSAYLARYEQGEHVWQIAESVNFPPTQLARLFLERLLGLAKPDVSARVKDRQLIADARLRDETELCVQKDERCSPWADKCRRVVGREYEYILEQSLLGAGLPFATEDTLRSQGFSKTPDVRLLVPFAVGLHVVNWIDSKAMFADRATHEQYLSTQYRSYVNRFGSGLVIYWFGFVEGLLDAPEPEVLVLDAFPRKEEIRTLNDLL